MKKILSLGVAAAIASMTAIAASAAVEPVVIDGDFTEGSTVTIELQAQGVDKANFKATVETAGLELVSAEVEGMGGGLKEGVLIWVDGAAPEDGDVIATLTYNVTAAAGETASFALTPASGYENYVDVTLNIEEEVVEVTTGDDNTGDDGIIDGGDDTTGGDIIDGGDDTTGGDIIDGGDDTTGDDTTGDDATGDDTTGDDAGSTDGADDENKAENPDTGIALAVVPAVLAGAAIVVSKKRK